MKTKEGLWKLSPSGLYKFEECKACFWLEHHHGKAPSLPWLLNSAMDSVLKARYDLYREKGELPPEVKKLSDDGIGLFRDRGLLDKWRGHVSHLKVVNEEVGYELVGKIDDVLVERDGRLIPTDFKSSGYAPKDDKQKYYVLQLHAYALMFKAHGYEPADRAYLLHYFIKDTKNPSLSVEFLSHIDMVQLDHAMFTKKLRAMVALLNGSYPGDDMQCKNCVYQTGAAEKRK